MFGTGIHVLPIGSEQCVRALNNLLMPRASRPGGINPTPPCRAHIADAPRLRQRQPL